jgi:GDP-mannose 6-dehydrogenase
MKVTIVGAGYVGAVTGACLAEMGHTVTVVDKDADKVSKLQLGRSPISEPYLESLLSSMTASGKLSATGDLYSAVIDADLVLVSVGTPTNRVDGSADLTAINRVFTELRAILGIRTRKLAIAITSTVPPGTTNQVARKILGEESIYQGKFTLAFIPEFLREGTAIDDFRNPSRFIVGIDSEDDALTFKALRPDLEDRTHIVGIPEAEMLKTVENAWHATKIVFANEIGRASESLGIQGKEVMNLLMLDTKQNISKTYLRPGFAFGGSCLPKDVRSLVRLTEVQAVVSPLLSSLIPSNKAQVDHAINQIANTGLTKVGVLGLAFKADTDDIRESPGLELIQRLIGSGYEVQVHDFEALRHDLYGANLATVEKHAHIRKLMVEDAYEVISSSDLIVVAQHNKKYLPLISGLDAGKILIDLPGLVG